MFVGVLWATNNLAANHTFHCFTCSEYTTNKIQSEIRALSTLKFLYPNPKLLMVFSYFISSLNFPETEIALGSLSLYF